MEEVFDALKKDKADIAFASRRRLVIYTNCYAETDLKINLVLDNTMDSSFGYNRNSAVLKSIIDKAIRFVRINTISAQWMYKTYDYERKIAEAQSLWLRRSLIVFAFMLILVLFLLIRKRSIIHGCFG
jgi:hypothetical protein